MRFHSAMRFVWKYDGIGAAHRPIRTRAHESIFRQKSSISHTTAKNPRSSLFRVCSLPSPANNHNHLTIMIARLPEQPQPANAMKRGASPPTSPSCRGLLQRGAATTAPKCDTGHGAVAQTGELLACRNT